MKILYHSDIIPELTMAFSMHSNIGNTPELLENLAIHRISNLITADGTSPIKQVGYTIQQYLATIGNDRFRDITDISTVNYLPEHLLDEKQRNLIIQMCASGRFIPLIMCLDMDDIKNCGEQNIAHVLAGFGQDAEYNFFMVTMDIQKIINHLQIEYVENSELVHSLYPIIFDLRSGLIGSLLDKSMVSIRSFTLKTTTEEALPDETVNSGTEPASDESAAVSG